MARVAAKVTCSDQDRAELERLSASRTEQARPVERAKMVLSCVAGERKDVIGARMGLQASFACHAVIPAQAGIQCGG